MRKDSYHHLVVRLIDWKRMCFSIENKLIQRKNVVVTKQQVQILQCFPQEEGLHLVSSPRGQLSDIIQRGISPRINFCVFFKGLKDLPTPFTVSAGVQWTKD